MNGNYKRIAVEDDYFILFYYTIYQIYIKYCGHYILNVTDSTIFLISGSAS